MKNLVYAPPVVQPHGALLVLDARDLGIVGVSESVRTVFGLSHRDLVGYPLSRLATAANLDGLTQALDDLDPIELTTHCRRRLQATPRRQGDFIVLELEQADESARTHTFGVVNRLRRSIARLRDATDLEDLSWRASEELRAVSGFERIGVHSFPLEEGDTQPVSVMHAPYMHFLATTKYTPSLVHAHPDVILPDLTCTELWSPSEDELANLRDLGIGATMEVSMMRDGLPAGLVFGHHRSTDHFVSHEARVACGLLTEVYASLVEQHRHVELASVPRLRRAADVAARIARIPKTYCRIEGGSGLPVESLDAVPAQIRCRPIPQWSDDTAAKPQE